VVDPAQPLENTCHPLALNKTVSRSSKLVYAHLERFRLSTPSSQMDGMPGGRYHAQIAGSCFDGLPAPRHGAVCGIGRGLARGPESVGGSGNRGRYCDAWRLALWRAPGSGHGGAAIGGLWAASGRVRASSASVLCAASGCLRPSAAGGIFAATCRGLSRVGAARPLEAPSSSVTPGFCAQRARIKT